MRSCWECGVDTPRPCQSRFFGVSNPTFLTLKRLEPVEDRGSFLHGVCVSCGACLTCANGLSFDLEIPFRVMIRRRWAGMTRIVADVNRPACGEAGELMIVSCRSSPSDCAAAEEEIFGPKPSSVLIPAMRLTRIPR